MQVNKIRILLSVLLVLSLLCVAVFAVWGYFDLQRESKQISAQPDSSGIDFLGVGIAWIAILIACITFAVSAVDMYWCLMYFLTSEKRTKRKKVMNLVSVTLSFVSLISVPLFFIVYADVILIGLFWSLICPIYRIVYLAINAYTG